MSSYKICLRCCFIGIDSILKKKNSLLPHNAAQNVTPFGFFVVVNVTLIDYTHWFSVIFIPRFALVFDTRSLNI